MKLQNLCSQLTLKSYIQYGSSVINNCSNMLTVTNLETLRLTRSMLCSVTYLSQCNNYRAMTIIVEASKPNVNSTSI
jgi:hypothetical protein